MRLLLIPALAGLTACAQPEPIVDYNAPYTGKYTAPVASVRPEARPMQRRWLACPNWPDDCGNGESAPVKNHRTTTGGGPFPVFPEVERPEPEPTPEPTPEPEPPVTEPEPPAPEPETHEPPPPEPEWCPA
jgi:hypothetical protein